MTGARLVWHQFSFDQKVFRRDPAAVGFTVVFPIIFLVIFVAMFGNHEIAVGDTEVQGSTYYVPGIVTLGIVSATYLNLAINLTALRERGVLKRLRSTPMSNWAFMVARIMTAIVVAFALTVVLVLLGRAVYGVELPGSTLPGALIALAVGAAVFCSLGLMLTAVIPTEASAAPITNAVVLPLYFISGVFVPAEQIPDSMLRVADFFPVKPLFDALLFAFDPTTAAPGIATGDLAVLLAWGVAGLVIAALTFRWTPRST